MSHEVREEVTRFKSFELTGVGEERDERVTEEIDGDRFME